MVRGQDHVEHARQLMILRALGAEPPVYAHIPAARPRRQEARSATARFRAGAARCGIPAGGRNMALLGWGYDETTTFMTTAELIERFSLERVSKNPVVFDEQKLRSMNAALSARASAPTTCAGGSRRWPDVTCPRRRWRSARRRCRPWRTSGRWRASRGAPRRLRREGLGEGHGGRGAPSACAPSARCSAASAIPSTRPPSRPPCGRWWSASRSSRRMCSSPVARDHGHHDLARDLRVGGCAGREETVARIDAALSPRLVAAQRAHPPAHSPSTFSSTSADSQGERADVERKQP